MTIVIGLAALLFFLAIGLPVALALALGGGIGLLVQGGPDLLVGILSTAPSSAISSYELLTIPMFLLMAEFMVVSGISHTLFSAISMWTSRMRGGLGLATAITGAAFGAISGSSTAAAATLSTSSIPSMIRQGYEKKITIWVLIWRNPSLAPEGYRTSWRDKVDSLKVAGPFVILFTLVTGLIYLGIATPVESSAMGALGALILTVLSGKLDKQSFCRAISRACMTSAMIGLIIVCAQLYGMFLTMTVPVVLPLVKSLGFDGIWFGIIIILLAEIGVVTPPVGLNVFVVSRTTKMPVEDVFHGVWPHVIAHVLLVIVLIMLPEIILWLPSRMDSW